MATQTLTPAVDVTDGAGLNLTALLAAPTATTLVFSNTGREKLLVSAGPAVTTTIASGSNGGEISAIASWSAPSSGVLDVASSAAFPSSGTVTVAASGSATAVVAYTGTGSGTLTGCSYVSGSATGTVATGGAVTLVAETVTVDVGALVDGQPVANFPAVTLTGSDLYQFGEFHSVLDSTGTNQIQVTLSAITGGITVALLQNAAVY